MAEISTKYAVCDLNDVREDLKIASDDTSFDNALRRLINGVSKRIETYTGTIFAARDFAAEMYDGSGTNRLMLHPAPIISISALINDTLTVDADDFVLYKHTGKVVLTDGTLFVCGPQTISVSGRRGYERQDMPDDIAMVARSWICQRFKTLEKQRWGVNSQTVTEESFSFDNSPIPADCREILDSYRGLR